MPFRTLKSPLRFQTRTISCYPDASCYALGSTEGRVSIQYVDEAKQGGNFSFKCHRKELQKSMSSLGNQWKTASQQVFAVNELAFNSLGSFVTTGTDGTLWCASSLLVPSRSRD